jgi:hypothetical protein
MVAEVVHTHPPEDVPEASEAHHQHGGDEHVAHEQPQEVVRHYNQARPHRGLQLADQISHPVGAPDGDAITRRDVVGGIVQEYDCAA